MVSSRVVHTVSYRVGKDVNNLLFLLTSHHLLIQTACVLWLLTNNLTRSSRFLICALGVLLERPL